MASRLVGGGVRRALLLGLLALTTLVLGLGGLQLRAGRYGFISGFLRDQIRGTGPVAARQLDPPSYEAVAATAPDATSPISVVEPQPSTDFVLTVAVNPPPDAVRMQVSTSVTFAGASWQDVPREVDVAVPSAGYQTIFARFELADGSLSPTWTAGGEVDPTWTAATSSADGDDHQPSWVLPFSATELVVRVEAGRMERGALEPYDLNDPADGDRVRRGRDLLLVNRNGDGYGLQVSERTDVIRRADRLVGRPLDVGAATSEAWHITSPDDPGLSMTIDPANLRVLSWPAGGGIDGDNEAVWEVTHDVILALPSPLTAGLRYRVDPAGSIAPTEFAYDPSINRSPAVRVTQVGFAPGDRPKVAYLSGWFDGIGDSAAEASAAEGGGVFTVIDDTSGEVVFTGNSSSVDEAAAELSGSAVVELDFTPLNESGRFRVCVAAVGCSYPFVIADDVWSNLADTVARATYMQRSGIALGPPYTPVVRPRPYHPADGVVVHGTGYTLLEARFDPQDAAFAALTANVTNERLDQAWGGHFDAGDWDRRIYHLWYARTAAVLVSEFGEYYGSRDLNIPESGDAVPDLLDEALWSLDFYRRLQRDDGAVSGGVEASEHPPENATSWVDDLAVYAYRPDAFSTYLYAGVAAEVSVALRPYDPARADGYLASALAAMEWAESAGLDELSTLGIEDPSDVEEATRRVADQRHVASAALLLATGERRWHDLFVETADYLDDDDPALSCHQHTRCDAAWLYLQVDPRATDEALREELTARFLRSADAIIDFAEANGYGWTTGNPNVPLIWGLGSGGAPHTTGLLRAYLLSGETRYREAAVRSASVAVGANPRNRSMITGVGREPVRHAQINDVKHGGLPLWAGTPVYGNHDLDWSTELDWVTDVVLTPAGADPDPRSLPYMWQWFDVSNVAVFNEFTVHQSHAEALFAFATLAATTPRD